MDDRLEQADAESMTYCDPWFFPPGTHRWDTRGAMVPEQRFPADFAERVSEPRYGFPNTEGNNSTNDPEVFGSGGYIPEEVMFPSGAMPADVALLGGEVRAHE